MVKSLKEGTDKMDTNLKWLRIVPSLSLSHEEVGQARRNTCTLRQYATERPDEFFRLTRTKYIYTYIHT